MKSIKAIAGADIFDGEMLHENLAIVFDHKMIVSILPENDIPHECRLIRLNGGMLVPGFVDLQVNGGGGILFNENPDLYGIKTICAAHARFGTTGLLITLITDTKEIVRKAIEAGMEASRKNVPGFLGLHLEGPHLSIARKGAHDPSLIRSMKQDDIELLLWAKKGLPNLMITVAPESVTPEQISTLTNAGVIVSLGHSNASYEQMCLSVEAGGACVTHLYNAMSPLTSREPGVVGTTLDNKNLFCGLIADGHHVAAATARIALASKTGRGKIFLVTDAMATVGTDISSFILNGRVIHKNQGKLTLEDGTLAGSDLNMIQAIRNIHEMANIDLNEAIRMATLYPCQCLGIDREHGRLKAGMPGNFVHINPRKEIESVWLDGKRIEPG